MRIRIKVAKSNIVPRPENCWSAELEYDNKPVGWAARNTLMVAAEFCRRSPFTDRTNLSIEFWDYTKRQVRECKTDCAVEVVYKMTNENKSNLQLFLMGIVSTAVKEYDDVEVLAEYLGSVVPLETLKDAKEFVDSITYEPPLPLTGRLY